MAYDSIYTGSEIDESIRITKNIINLIYPVGSIYMSVNNISPQTFIGGTWTQIQNTFLLAAGSNYMAGSTGGSATAAHTHNVTAAGSVGGHTLTIAEMPKHRHQLKRPQFYSADKESNSSTGSCYSWRASTGGTTYKTYSSDWSNLTTDANEMVTTGGNGSHNHGFTGSEVTSGAASNENNMPPYLTVYMWKRTA